MLFRVIYYAAVQDVTTLKSHDDVSALQNRIGNLVQSNQNKINRIKLLLTEREAMKSEIDTLNRLNLSMADTIDAYRADEIENRPPTIEIMQMDSQIDELKNEVQSLRDRVGNLNRANFQLEEENKRFKSILRTHSTQVLGEHNYQMSK